MSNQICFFTGLPGLHSTGFSEIIFAQLRTTERSLGLKKVRTLYIAEGLFFHLPVTRGADCVTNDEQAPETEKSSLLLRWSRSLCCLVLKSEQDIMVCVFFFSRKRQLGCNNLVSCFLLRYRFPWV